MMESKPCWIDFYERGKFTECDCNYEKDCRECERFTNDTRKEFERILERKKICTHI